MESRAQIYLSYARPDSDKVEALYERLLEENFAPWMDEKVVLSGESAEAGISEALRSADFILACLSNNAVTETGVLDEGIRKCLDFSWRRTDGYAYLIVGRLEECPVPENLIAFEQVDLFKDNGWAELLGIIEQVRVSRGELQEHSLDMDLSIFGATVKVAEGGSLEGPENPLSVRDWAIDLRRLLDGERENLVVMLGGAVEYVEVMLEEAEDRAAARYAFHEALNGLVQTWQPSALESNYYVIIMLDLIGAYTPSPGFNKVIDFIQRQRYFALSETADETHEPAYDAYLKALVVLENYYRVPPPPPEDEAPAYLAYIDILQEDFSRLEYCGYALKRLVQLKVIPLDSPEIDSLIKRNPQSLKELLNLLLDPNRSSAAERDLALVYVACLDAGGETEEYFERAVVACGGRLERKDPGPVIVLEDRAINLSLPQEAQYKYWGLLMDRDEQEGLEKYDTMAG